MHDEKLILFGASDGVEIIQQMGFGLITLKCFQRIIISNHCCSITLESCLQDGCTILFFQQKSVFPIQRDDSL